MNRTGCEIISCTSYKVGKCFHDGECKYRAGKVCYNKTCDQYDETCEFNCNLKYPEQREACFGFVGKEEEDEIHS